MKMSSPSGLVAGNWKPTAESLVRISHRLVDRGEALRPCSGSSTCLPFPRDLAPVGARTRSCEKCRLERITAITKIAEAWLAPASRWMRCAKMEISRSGIYSPEMVEACLKTVFAGYDAEALKGWVRQNRTVSWRRHARANSILIILPATVFAPAWQAATAVWLAGHKVVFKLSKREPVFPMLLAKSIRAIVGDLLPIEVIRNDACTRYALPAQLKKKFHAVIAYGSDHTVQTLCSSACGGLRPPTRQVERRYKKNLPFVGFGTMASLAYASRRTLSGNNWENLISKAALDTVLYDTRGCLSPHCFYVQTGGKKSPEEFAVDLGNAMNRLDVKLPQTNRLVHSGRDDHPDRPFGRSSRDARPVLDPEIWIQESFWQHWRFRESQGKAKIFRKHVVFHKQTGFEPCGLKRVVFVKPIRNEREMLKDVKNWTSKISTIAVSDSSSLHQLQYLLKSRKHLRFCEIGRMHEPLPSWKNGGINLLKILANPRLITID